ncbi:hypothetical protein GCM10027515_09870 [Schumannella luteola]|uniref:Uncharacterized protein YndB with AHSA1/START domain n=1 Tax=Schumannella luteola TaxID=472059 RepID=A0A852YJR3_9MICO|nr:SRPBCC domain-containing protein [Schumannella luteola]NYG97435.1 uncharacterized protein YndB with AHSA1/START domain [Schumannella luteola]TPX01678.1 hypothetical protein FJ656_26580 [Schumannella luteola]
MTADRIYEVEVAADAETAWAALTEPETVHRYYYGTAPRTTWEVGSPIEFVDGDGDVQITGEVLEHEPPRRLAHSFVATWYGEPDDQGSLHWTITPTATGCRVTLVHRGARAQTREGSETADGSRHIIDALKSLLDGPDISSSIVIDAPLERVWDAIVDSAAFGAWFGAEFDGPFEVGATTTGRIRPTAVDPEVAAAQEPHRGAPLVLHVTAIEPRSRFAFRWHPIDGEDATTTVEVIVEEAAEGTLVTFTENGFDALPEDRRTAAREGNEGGWDAQTRLLAGYLAA